MCPVFLCVNGVILYLLFDTHNLWNMQTFRNVIQKSHVFFGLRSEKVVFYLLFQVGRHSLYVAFYLLCVGYEVVDRTAPLRVCHQLAYLCLAARTADDYAHLYL